MKKIFGVLILWSCFIVGCKDFLDEENKSGIPNEEFYKTAVGYETLIAASYGSLRTVYGDLPWLLVAGTDMYQRNRGDGDRSIQEYQQLYSTDEKVETFYRDVYEGIQTINMALYYSDLPELSEQQRATYRAELRFLRAFYHFSLIEQFGGIVINNEPTLAPRMDLPRSSLEESYNFVISEMEAALPDLGTAKARVNKEVCNHYLAKAYLTRGWDLEDNTAFEKAKQYATAAIGGKGITIPFEQLWSPSNENNDEVIFAVQYDAKSIGSSSSGNRQQSNFGPYLGGSESNHKYMSGIIPSWSLHTFYSENDARYDATFMLTIYDQYFDYYDKDTSNLIIRAYYPRVWGREYTEAERQAWLEAHEGRIPNNIRIFPFKYDEEAYREAYQSDFASPVIKKFDSPSTRAIFDTHASVRDIVLARRAETYFLYAEACIGLNDFTTASQYVQTVLNRPGNAKNGGTLSQNADIATAGSQSEALNRYLIESAKEFAGEYLRWPELRRTGKLKEFLNRFNYDIKQLGGADVALRGLDGQDKLYRPIPQVAININDALSEDDQNPGY